MSIIAGAKYKRNHKKPLSRRELKALRQHDAAEGKRVGLCSYKMNHTIEFFSPKWGYK